jgi:hypothetical protein
VTRSCCNAIGPAHSDWPDRRRQDARRRPRSARNRCPLSGYSPPGEPEGAPLRSRAATRKPPVTQGHSPRRSRRTTPNPIPDFVGVEDEAAWWDTHHITDFLDELKPVRLRVARKALARHHGAVRRADAGEAAGAVARAEHRPDDARPNVDPRAAAARSGSGRLQRTPSGSPGPTDPRPATAPPHVSPPSGGAWGMHAECAPALWT